MLSAAILDRYVGEYKMASGPATFAFRRAEAMFCVKAGPNPEDALVARSETRFSYAGPLAAVTGPVFDFHLDAQGNVAGAIMEQGAQKMQLVRM